MSHAPQATADDCAINAAIDLLRSQGFVVDKEKYGPWITPKELWRQIGRFGYTGFHRRLVNYPGDYPQRLGPTGRLIELRTTPALMKWLGKSKQQGTKML